MNAAFAVFYKVALNPDAARLAVDLRPVFEAAGGFGLEGGFDALPVGHGGGIEHGLLLHLS